MASRPTSLHRSLFVSSALAVMLTSSLLVSTASAEPSASASGTGNLAVGVGPVQSGLASKADSIGPVEVSGAVYSDVSAPVRDLVGVAPASSDKEKEKKEKPLRVLPNMGNALHQADGALQTAAGPLAGTTSGLNFAGVGQGDHGFSDQYAPPDTNGAVGATQYVQWVNVSFAVFDKTTGAIATGFPKAGNSIWAGFGGGCETNNNGDPIVQYDKLANRWILTQFSVSTTPYLQCVAVSTTSDATGSYYRYAFSYGTQFNDYPKLGVWPDGYYLSYNIFNNAQTWGGAKACSLDRTKMLVGDPTATQQCFQLSTSYGGLLPSDLDGATPPPAGSPDYFMNFGLNRLNLWKFHVDFTTPANTTFTGPTSIAVASFSAACSGGGTCIPQPGTTQKLDSLADRLMYRLAYRNFGDHQSLVVNHSVTAGTATSVRWYEIRSPGGTPAVYQQGTLSASDGISRWMGSVAMDKLGNIALGYSASSSSVYPSIRYTGRLATDALNTMQAESLIQAGAGSQTASLSRWGDYSAMTVDPVDDCTFWYTNEYLKANGTWNWSTRIASFRFPNCVTSVPVLTTISVSPASASVQTGQTQQFTATGLDQFGNPVSPQPTFSWSVAGGGAIDASGLFTAGSAAGGPFVVTAANGSVSGTANVSVTSVPSDFSLSVSPPSQSVKQGNAATYVVTITPSNGVNGSVTLSVTGLPSAFTATFSPNPATTTTSTLTVKTVQGYRGTYKLTIQGVSGGLQHTTPATLTVTNH